MFPSPFLDTIPRLFLTLFYSLALQFKFILYFLFCWVMNRMWDIAGFRLSTSWPTYKHILSCLLTLSISYWTYCRTYLGPSLPLPSFLPNLCNFYLCIKFGWKQQSLGTIKWQDCKHLVYNNKICNIQLCLPAGWKTCLLQAEHASM